LILSNFPCIRNLQDIVPTDNDFRTLGPSTLATV
jgi:hypothetical protein